MELLQYEEEQYRYKLTNIFFQYIKNALQLYVCADQAVQIFVALDSQYCSVDERAFINISYVGALALLIFNVVSAMYILCQKHFPRIEYFIVYILNVFWFLSLLSFGAKLFLTQRDQCEIVTLMMKSFLYLGLVCQIDLLIIMFLKNENSNRQVNICSNVLFLFLALTSQIDPSCAFNPIAIQVMLFASNILPIIFLTVINICIMIFSKMKEQFLNVYRFGCVVTISFLILDYILMVYYLQSGDIQQNVKCINLTFISKTYIYAVPITMLGMVPIVYSIKFQKQQNEKEEEELEDLSNRKIENQ